MGRIGAAPEIEAVRGLRAVVRPSADALRPRAAGGGAPLPGRAGAALLVRAARARVGVAMGPTVVAGRAAPVRGRLTFLGPPLNGYWLLLERGQGPRGLKKKLRRTRRTFSRDHASM